VGRRGGIANATADPGVIGIDPFKRRPDQMFTVASKELEIVILS